MRGLGFAGFRVHFPVNTPSYRDEILVFLGASYFRGLGRGQRYGLSARGLAIDIGESRFRRLDRGKPVELRAHLKHGNETVSETWNYIVPSE